MAETANCPVFMGAESLSPKSLLTEERPPGELLKSFVEMKVSVGKEKEQNPALLFPKTDSILDLTGARQLR